MPHSRSRHQLHLVTEPRHTPEALIGVVSLAVDGGVDWVQLRNKTAPAAGMYAQAHDLLRVVRQHGAYLAINDRLDVALAVGAHGVHLAGQSLPVDAAVRLAEGHLLVGRSVHARAEAIEAAAAGADYLTFGHVFPTASHPGLPPRGLSELGDIVQAVDVPVLAIGGINIDNLDDVLATGCAGIAVISAILADDDPSQAVARLRGALDASAHQPRQPFPVPVPEIASRESNAAHRQPTAV